VTTHGYWDAVTVGLFFLYIFIYYMVGIFKAMKEAKQEKESEDLV